MINAANQDCLLLLLDETFPSAISNDLQRVADDVLTVLQQRCVHPPPAGSKPIICTLGTPPMVDAWTLFYRVRLNGDDRDYCRFAYQLGHELGHIFLEPRRTNGLLETLATMISLQVLDDLAHHWATQPPYAHWQAFAPAFTTYRQSVEQAHLNSFPAEVQAAVQDGNWSAIFLYLRYRCANQDARLDDRDLNHLGAIALRAFLSPPLPWPDLVGIGAFTDPSPEVDSTFRNDLQLDLSQVASTLQPLLQHFLPLPASPDT